MCDLTRGDPGGFAITNEHGVTKPSSSAVAVPTNGVVASQCVGEKLSNAHKRFCAEHTLEDDPCGTQPPERIYESDVTRPSHAHSREPEYSNNPSNSTIAEWVGT